MNGHQSGGEAEPPGPPRPAAPANTDRRKTGLDDPRALDILTTEHWSLLSTRTLGYQEMFGRTTVFVAILSGTVVALALLAQATHFRREALWSALTLMTVALFIRPCDSCPERGDQLRGRSLGRGNESGPAGLPADCPGAGTVLRDGS
jgi:hypothetical protein